MNNKEKMAPKSLLSYTDSSLLRVNKERYHDILAKKPALPLADKGVILCATVEDKLSDTEVGYVNLSRFLYLMANLEDLKGTLRLVNAEKRAALKCAKLRGFDNKVAKRFETFALQEVINTKDRYSEVMEGLSRLAIGPLTGLREINSLKKVFTDLLDKHRSTAFFNITTSSRILPNKYHVFNALLSCTILNGAINKEEMGYLVLASEYINPYHYFFKTAAIYSSLYNKGGVAIHTELNAVCDKMYGEYYTLMESSKFMLLLRLLCSRFCTQDRGTPLFSETISDMCALYFTTASAETGTALSKLRPLVDVKLLTV